MIFFVHLSCYAYKHAHFSLTGTRDSSGIRIFYTNISREHDAGILDIGHSVTPLMIIPPNTPNYTIAGVCAPDCTEKV